MCASFHLFPPQVHRSKTMDIRLFNFIESDTGLGWQGQRNKRKLRKVNTHTFQALATWAQSPRRSTKNSHVKLPQNMTHKCWSTRCGLGATLYEIGACERTVSITQPRCLWLSLGCSDYTETGSTVVHSGQGFSGFVEIQQTNLVSHHILSEREPN